MALPTLAAEVAAPAEPNVAMARRWWPPLTNVYTPIGWKNHLFRFNVYYNGTIMADPCPEHAVSALEKWKGLGAQFSIMPSEGGLDPYRWRAGTFQMTTDNGRRWNYQGLLGRPTPVIWTEWRNSFRSAIGFVLRQEAFAHVTGGKEIESGTEPLFAWVRMSIAEVNPLMKPPPCAILVRINKPHIFPEMYEGRNCALRASDSLYPRELSLERIGPAERPGGLVLEAGGEVRAGVLPGRATKIELVAPPKGEQNYNLLVTLPVEKGAYVDLLLPMLPESRQRFEQESALGREKALAESDAYWSNTPSTAARIQTPERYVNEYLRRNAQYGELIAQRMPDSGHYTNLTGSQVYARMWATPTTMFDTMLLDTLGYHQAVDRYLEIFRDTQGSVKPPGPAYDPHPGYFATPKSLTSIDWLSDHGAVLHAVCYHALITNDQTFIERWMPAILKACDFIREACRKTNHEGVQGLLPPAVATDQGVPTQAVWNMGWHYRGLISAVTLLERLEHPHAGELAEEARRYRQTFIEALRAQTQREATWTDKDGREHHLVPTSLSAGGDLTHGFYLDTGPLFLVYAGLLNADDPLMQSALMFFREGPNHVTFDRHGHFEQPPVLIHELSSCEPPASFNLFHSHQLADRYKYFEGLYSQLTGAHSQQTYTACETRGGITGLCGHIGIYGLRLAVVDDWVEADALHLLRLVPLAWLSEKQPARFERIPTIHGPVTVRFKLLRNGAALHVEYAAKFHHAPQRILLHVPPLKSLTTVTVNGRERQVRPGDVVTLP
ncbi:MAG: hypothetical protein AMXMBFR13_22890 [Phycisphaerae bacterium]